MKTIISLTLITGVLSACQQTDVSALLKNEDTRNEVFDAIVAEHEYAQQLMATMMEDDHTKMLMKGNADMMGMMMSDNDQMISMMKDKPDMMHNMMGNMMNMANMDSSMCTHMMTMMKDKPKVMGQMMDMMHTEGMMDKETMMKNKEKIGAENQPGHH